jgi:RNA polymerase sigma factor (TIGR02999 family)
MSQPITELIAHAGTDPEQRSRLLQQVYQELLQLARRELVGRRAEQTLSTAPLVHEAYLKLFAQAGAHFDNRAHFFGAAARAMRQVVIDYARARQAQSRGNGAPKAALEDLEQGCFRIDDQAEALVRIDAALNQLAQIDERAVSIVELRYFSGLEVSEIAPLLNLSEATVKRDSRFAREFLIAALA